jgi:predicted aminopeptidase
VFPHLAVLFIIALAATGCSTGYLADTAYHHLRLLAHRTAIRDVIADADSDPMVRERLSGVEAIRRFAAHELGMAVDDNYATYVAVDGPYVTHNLSACPPDRFAPYLWHFPVVGAVPYKGFFHREQAEQEERGLRAAGYETYLRGVRAYSTLGWFSDPVFSTMLGDDPYELADLLFHELTHATVFIRGQIDFNESLASFVAEQATLRYVAREAGPDSAPYRARVAVYAEERRFNALVHRLYLDLDALYQRRPADLDAQRAAAYAEFRAQLLADDSGITAPGYRRFAALPPNNARLLSYHRYHSGRDAFDGLLASHGGDIAAFLATLRRHRDEVRDDPFTAVAQLAMSPPG